MVFGQRSGSEGDPTKEKEKAERQQLRIEAKEKRAAIRQEKAEKRRSELEAQAEKRKAQEARELDLFGKKVIQEMCAGKTVRIYDKGYVRVSGLFGGNGAVFEKLKAISGSADVAKKTALGRTVMAGATMGLNLVTTPNKRGDIYLAITTERTTHMIHMSTPTERDLKAMHKISSAGQGVLDSIARLTPNNVATTGSSPALQAQPDVEKKSVADELIKLAALRDTGALTNAEFSKLKAQIIEGS